MQLPGGAACGFARRTTQRPMLLSLPASTEVGNELAESETGHSCHHQGCPRGRPVLAPPGVHALTDNV